MSQSHHSGSSHASRRSESPSVTRRSATSALIVGNGSQAVVQEMSQQAPKSRSVGASGRIMDVPTVGTMVNPAATAYELLSKTPSIKQQQSNLSQQSNAPSSPGGASAGSRVASSPSGSHMASGTASSPPSQVASSTSPASRVASASSPSGGSGVSAASQRSPAGPSSAYQSGAVSARVSAIAESQKQSSRSKNQASSISDIGGPSMVGHGVIDVNMRTAAIIQIVFSLMALACFTSLWIYHLGYADCFRDLTFSFIMKVIAIAGALCSLFTLLHSCFERKVTSRGVWGCVMFFVITCVVFANILVAFRAMNCICTCAPGLNAWVENSTPDLVIFALSIMGSFCLILILLVASVVHK